MQRKMIYAEQEHGGDSCCLYWSDVASCGLHCALVGNEEEKR
jgi:hypothetical protein